VIIPSSPVEFPVAEILGVPVHQVTMEQTIHLIGNLVNSKKSHLIVTLGTEMIMAVRKKNELNEILQRASLIVPDGGGIIWAAKRLGKPLMKKLAGIELIEKICSISGENNWNLFFLGGRPGISEKAIQKLKQKFPSMKAVGAHHGYFNQNEISSILKKQKIDILFAGMGFPLQEKWILENIESFKIPVGIGVGGSLDVLSGVLKRAPEWMIRSNLEWLYRLLQEPRRWKRMMTIPEFMLIISFLSLTGSKKGRSTLNAENLSDTGRTESKPKKGE
jgi:N-acetylglucosaminyldiphosphoundecaprenol N-acetyl-beta-D-mannosaminyltransferase